MSFLKWRKRPDSKTTVFVSRFHHTAPKTSSFIPLNKYLLNKNLRSPLVHEAERVTVLVLSVCVGHEFRLDEHEACFPWGNFLFFKSQIKEWVIFHLPSYNPGSERHYVWVASYTHLSRWWLCSIGLRQLPRRIIENIIILLE